MIFNANSDKAVKGTNEVPHTCKPLPEMQKRRVGSCEVFTVQDLQSFLERFDFRLAPSYTVLVAHIRVNARWLELLIVCECSIELLLCALQILLFDDHSLRLV